MRMIPWNWKILIIFRTIHSNLLVYSHPFVLSALFPRRLYLRCINCLFLNRNIVMKDILSSFKLLLNFILSYFKLFTIF